MALDNFIPEIWSAQLLVNLKNDLVFAGPSVANRNYEGEVRRFGDTVRINSIGAVSVSAYSKNTDHSAPETLSDSQMVLAIDQGDMFNFQIDDIDRAQQNPKLMSAAMREASFALADSTDDFVSTLIDDAATALASSPVTVSADFNEGYEVLVDLSVQLDENNAPSGGRWVITTPANVGVLRKDDRFASFGTAANRAVASSGGGAVGEMAGFTIFVSNKTPEDGSANPQLLAGHPMALTYASQIESLEAYRPELRFADAMKGLHVYGGKVIRPELLHKVALA